MEQESIEILLQNRSYAIQRIVRYIYLPPTLCRSEQTLHLIVVASPRQYFYLSCETAIQIDEVQQHDIFCTSITLQGWATWVKSQQTITFPDIPPPHTVTVDGFSLTKRSLSPRTESALKSLLFSSPHYALAPCPNRDELCCRTPSSSALVVRREKHRVAPGHSRVYPDCIASVEEQWAKRHITQQQLLCASSDLIQLQSERQPWKLNLMALH